MANFSRYARHGIRQNIQLPINPGLWLIECGAEKHAQIVDFEHGIIFY